MTKLLLLAFSGAAGTLARYGLSGAVHRICGSSFAWGTFAVNMAGTFLFGLVWAAAAERNLMGPETRVLVLTGFMGAFTTYSTFMFESGQYIRDSQWLLMAANIGGHVVLGLLLFFAGLAVGRLI